ncbi:AmmeMemoRadiSam system protein A [Thiomicrorhabdus chilensis]|uniref:AmmeMemoRadiSam system protein A n=1 Tax=Thiomicrorhabdus chilensis TaxID=63656 RepID=UPI000412B684|nr:AmmeMemoRadiSam system protein A [Thiomicrorhabdus chilensis]
MTLSVSEQNYLLGVAKQSIEHGLEHGVQKPPGSYNLPLSFQHFENEQACFVTLNKEAQLRGCIGTLEATRALIEDVSHNAFHAAFSDPRFSPLDIQELERLNIGISLLSPPQEMEYCQTMEDLLEQLKPEEDGLIISDGARRATFLPSVWEQLPDKRQFVHYLMRKAGISVWSEGIRCERYRSHSFDLGWHRIESYAG